MKRYLIATIIILAAALCFGCGTGGEKNQTANTKEEGIQYVFNEEDYYDDEYYDGEYYDDEYYDGEYYDDEYDSETEAEESEEV